MATSFPNLHKAAEPAYTQLSKPELIELCRKTFSKLKELEGLVEVIAKGKFQWEATFDAIAEPVMIVSQDYEIRRANLAMARTAGVNITQVTGRKCHEIFASRAEPCENCPLSSAVKLGKGEDEPLRNKIQKQDFHAYAYPFVESNGKCDSAVMYYRNITEEIRLRQEVFQQEKMAAIGMLAGGVAHEVNNPLGGVLAFTQLLLQRVKPADPFYEDLKEIESAAVRCKKIIQDLLDFSRVSRDKENALVDVNVLLEKVVPFVRMELRSLNVDLKLNLDKQVPKIEGAPDRLQQVFLNLMTNACHAMPKGGNLSLTTKKSPKGIEIEVKDSGAGIPKENLNRIFEPFFTTKQAGKGTGLGLAISYRIIQDHGGRMVVESEIGRGTTFTLFLPATRT